MYQCSHCSICQTLFHIIAKIFLGKLRQFNMLILKFIYSFRKFRSDTLFDLVIKMMTILLDERLLQENGDQWSSFIPIKLCAKFFQPFYWYYFWIALVWFWLLITHLRWCHLALVIVCLLEFLKIGVLVTINKDKIGGYSTYLYPQN